MEAMRAILRDCSEEMERCREELVLVDREKGRLRALLEDAEADRGRLSAQAQEKEIEIQRWRENYYTLKTHF
jgi:hypothetical protein